MSIVKFLTRSLTFVLFERGKFYGVETESRYICTRHSAPERFAQFAWQTHTFCNKKRTVVTQTIIRIIMQPCIVLCD